MGGAPPPRLAVREHIPLPPTMQLNMHIFSHFPSFRSSFSAEAPIAAGFSRIRARTPRVPELQTSPASARAGEALQTTSSLRDVTWGTYDRRARQADHAAERTTVALHLSSAPVPHARTRPLGSLALALPRSRRRRARGLRIESARPEARSTRPPSSRLSPLVRGRERASQWHAEDRRTGGRARSPTRPIPICDCSPRCRPLALHAELHARHRTLARAERRRLLSSISSAGALLSVLRRGCSVARELGARASRSAPAAHRGRSCSTPAT